MSKDFKRVLLYVALILAFLCLVWVYEAYAQGPAGEEVPILAGWQVVYVVLTATQLVKKLAEPHLKGKRSAGLALFLGAVLFGINSAAGEGVMTEAAMKWVRIVVRTIGYTVSVPGLYSLMKDEALPAIGARK